MGPPQSPVQGTRSVLQHSCVELGLYPMARHWRAHPQAQDIWDLTLAPGGVTAPQTGSHPGVYLSWGESVRLAEVGSN